MDNFCPEKDCGFQLVRVGDSVYCPACGWSSEVVNTKESEELDGIYTGIEL